MPDVSSYPEIPDGITPTPWDSVILGIPTFEITHPGEKALLWAQKNKGHFTVRLSSEKKKAGIEKFGFYYCDTLIEPHCTRDAFRGYNDPELNISLSSQYRLDEILDNSRRIFSHDRFHKDPNICSEHADRRYLNWIRDLHKQTSLYALYLDSALVGFWSSLDNKIPLHAVFAGFQGKGLGKHLWTKGCEMMFDKEYDEICSSVSISNLPIMNLYSSLGFKFYHPMDIFHLYNA